MDRTRIIDKAYGNELPAVAQDGMKPEPGESWLQAVPGILPVRILDVDMAAVQREIEQLEAQLADKRRQMAGYLRELGLGS